jgi:hypothetical protein
MRPVLIRRIVFGMGVIAMIVAIGGGSWAWMRAQRPTPPDQVIEAYFNDLDFRRYENAYARLDPKTRSDFATVMFQWHWRGGLIASYGKLIGFRSEVLAQTEDLVDWRIHLDWLTALDVQHQVLDMRGVRRDGHWFVVPTDLRPQQTPVRIQRETGVLWNVTGRRQALADTDLHRDRLDRPEVNISGARLVRYNGLYSVVGQMFNTSAEPAYVTLQSALRGEADQVLAEQSAAMVSGQRLLPAESSGFRVAFEGVLSMRDAAAAAGYDPKLFVPPVLDATPVTASIDTRALVATANLYRGIALNGLTFSEDAKGLKINGTAANVGTLTASVIRITAMGYDENGLPIWVDAGYVDSNILPGQATPFEMRLPPRSAVELIAEIGPDQTMINGSGQRPNTNVPQSGEGTVRLNNLAGYGALRFQITSMTYEPEF